MGLMEGLSNWLRQIIAVVLLASLIDLLLPNRTMQRYVRLVAGLFILMTVATPIMHWMKGDFTNKLAEGLNAVERTPDSADQQMAMIEEEGAKLRDKHNVQAADLVSTKLAAAIRSEVEQSEQREVRKVDVKLERGTDGALRVAKIAILLEPDPTSSAGVPSGSPAENIEPIATVDIRIEIEDWAGKTEPGTEGEQPVLAEPQEMETDKETRSRISALVASQFGLPANIVEVKLLTYGTPE